MGSESTYSECETFTDEDTGTLVPPECLDATEEPGHGALLLLTGRFVPTRLPSRQGRGALGGSRRSLSLRSPSGKATRLPVGCLRAVVGGICLAVGALSSRSCLS